VKRMRADHAPVGGNTNERAGGCHGACSRVCLL
jgi:hypothetical protein